MTQISEAITTVRRVSEKLSTLEFAKLSGVPYTTLRDCQARGFRSPAVDTLEKLVAAALAFEAKEAAEVQEAAA